MNIEQLVKDHIWSFEQNKDRGQSWKGSRRDLRWVKSGQTRDFDVSGIGYGIEIIYRLILGLYWNRTHDGASRINAQIFWINKKNSTDYNKVSKKLYEVDYQLQTLKKIYNQAQNF